jgi:zinc-ribbon domain
MALISCPECGREVSDQAPACPHCGAPIARPQPPQALPPPAAPPQPAKKKTGCFTAGCAVVLGAGLLLFIIGLMSQGGKTPPAPPPSPEKTALENVELVDFSWAKEGFGSVMLAKFVLRNNNDFAVKDIRIKCTHTAKSGTVIDSNTRTVYDLVEAKSKKTIRDFNMGFIHNQVDRSSCEVDKVVVVEKAP